MALWTWTVVWNSWVSKACTGICFGWFAFGFVFFGRGGVLICFLKKNKPKTKKQTKKDWYEHSLRDSSINSASWLNNSFARRETVKPVADLSMVWRHYIAHGYFLFLPLLYFSLPAWMLLKWKVKPAPNTNLTFTFFKLFVPSVQIKTYGWIIHKTL